MAFVDVVETTMLASITRRGAQGNTTMRSDLGWQWTQDDLTLSWADEVVVRWTLELPLCYLDGARVQVQAMLGDDRWHVSDRGGALAHSSAPYGVIGTMMGCLEGFSCVDMTGDGHFFLKVPTKPARSLHWRIDQAASIVAGFSVLAALAGPPPGWPPTLVIHMDTEEALRRGVLSPRSLRGR